MTKKNKIATPAELRAVLLATIEGVIEGRVNVAMANSVVGLSSEVHKSVRQEWDMRVFAANNLVIQKEGLIKTLLDSGEGEDSV